MTKPGPPPRYPRLGGLDPSPPRYESAGTWWSKEAEQARHRAKVGARLDQMFGRLKRETDYYGAAGFVYNSGPVGSLPVGSVVSLGPDGRLKAPTYYGAQSGRVVNVQAMSRGRHCTPYPWITEHGQGARCFPLRAWRTQSTAPLRPCTP